jgi:4-hydroxybenzoate polyprenyltransferase
VLDLIRRLLTFVRFSHTIFALPFALGSMIVAARGLPTLRTILLIVLAMVSARTAAMAFNRVADWEIDKGNPRTAGRHRLVSKRAAVWLVIISSIAFIATCAFINLLCFLLSPVALGIVFFYSLTKRFTSFTQFFIGLALAVSPVGAWLAVRGRFGLAPLMLAIGVVFWVAGFDLIYAIQDFAFDRKKGLGSLVVKYGIATSLKLAQILHAALFVSLVVFGLIAGLGAIYYGAMLLVLAALIYEHRAAARLDLPGINRAFFQSNAFVSVVFVTAVSLDVLVQR